ncbi:lachesin-like, partial [Oratosquilla oratoria]|uniref:lachesin-like n=1 Tax=Oratosquilla oratoria TaxID=337810 RepID=UPI003F76E8B7
SPDFTVASKAPSTPNHRKHTRREADRNPGLSPAEQNNTVVHAQVGGTASLQCYTQYLNEGTVSWLKGEDDQLLTAGQQLYTTENRISVKHLRHEKLWELHIQDVKMTDQGEYECQVTSHPPVSIFFKLKVVQVYAVIDNAPEIHVGEGYSLRLTCSAPRAITPPVYIFWYHNGTMINYERSRDLEVTKDNFSSSLTISRVSKIDAGVYRCEPHLAKPANVTLHVLENEKPAAMQHGRGMGDDGSSSSSSSSSSSTTSGASPSPSTPSSSSSIIRSTNILLFFSCWMPQVLTSWRFCLLVGLSLAIALRSPGDCLVERL